MQDDDLYHIDPFMIARNPDMHAELMNTWRGGYIKWPALLTREMKTDAELRTLIFKWRILGRPNT